MSDDEWFHDFEDDSQLSDGSRGGDSDDQGPLQGEVPTSRSTDKPPPYTILDKASLAKIQSDAIAQVTGILGCSSTTARALLIYFSWDAETVLGTLAERDEAEVYRKAGVVTQSTVPPTCSTHSGAIPCSVCLCDVPSTSTSSMACGHAFCNDCWRQHARIAITEGLGRALKCMAPGCGVVAEESVVRRLLGDTPPLLERYSSSLIESYVEDNRRVKWCPSVPHCGRAVAVAVGGELQCEVTCGCGQEFCFACTQQPHSPATCVMLREWLHKIQEGSETVSWLSANTKICPKCAKPVEKNGGCNLVVCRCGQAFCWLCGQATGRAHTWTNIEGHSCGAYKEEAESRATEAQRTLARYLHYLTRYEAHLQSLKLEHGVREDLDRKVDELIEAETALSNYSWLHEALEQLFLARRIMAYSYIFAYYMFGGGMYDKEISSERNAINQALFEDKQGQLEVEVERLSKLLEAGSAGAIATERMGIINLAQSINARICKMYEVIENDIAGQLAGCSLDVAPYRGQRSAAVAATVELLGGGTGEGPSRGGTAESVETIDLTQDDDVDEPPRRRSIRDAIKRLRTA